MLADFLLVLFFYNNKLFPKPHIQRARQSKHCVRFVCDFPLNSFSQLQLKQYNSEPCVFPCKNTKLQLLLLIYTTYKKELTEPLLQQSNFLILFCRCPSSHQYFFQSLFFKRHMLFIQLQRKKRNSVSQIPSLVRSIHCSHPGKNLVEGAGVSLRGKLNLPRREEITIL